MKSLFLRITHFDAHQRLLTALGVTAVVFGVLFNGMKLPMLVVATWIAYAATVLLLTWATILTAHPREATSYYKLQDSSRTAIFLFVLVAASVSFLAVVKLLGAGDDPLLSRVLSALSVACSWGLVHTLFTLRYAHLFYGETKGGLEFPAEPAPDYLDFAYFAFVIGMAAQVSDVQVTSRRMRRLVLVHGLLSFAFNTVIVALGINIISGSLNSL
jgi:uncharacterized membrane protein